MHDVLRRLCAAPIAHRGLHACGRPGGPVENSIAAAAAAITGGFGIECDIQLSRDGEAMVFHDERLERLTGGTGFLADHTAAALTAMTLGGAADRIPMLSVFLEAIDGRSPVVIEIKAAGNGDTRLTDRALAIIADYAGPVALESFDAAVVAHCLGRARCPVGLVGPSGSSEAPDPGLVGSCDFLSWSIDDLDAIAARFPDKPLTTWTVRTQAQRVVAARCRAQIVFEGFVPVTPR